jgi:hypothetical protein
MLACLAATCKQNAHLSNNHSENLSAYNTDKLTVQPDTIFCPHCAILFSLRMKFAVQAYVTVEPAYDDPV